MLPMWMLGAVLWGASEAKPVTVDNLKPYQLVYLAAQRDTLRNCDTTSSYRALLRSSKHDDENLPKGADAFTAAHEPVLEFKFLNSSGDSLFFMASMADSVGRAHYTSLCLERRDLLQVYGVPPGEDSTRGEGHHRGGGGGGRHRGMGGSGGSGGMGGMEGGGY